MILLLEILAVVVPLAVFALIARRRAEALERAGAPRPPLLLLLLSLGLGVVSFVPAWLVEDWVEGWAGLDEHARHSGLSGLVYAFFVAAPLEQGLKVLAVVPAVRSPRFNTESDGLLYASAVGLGFVSAHNTELFVSGGIAALDVARALLAVPAHVFFAAGWGFVLGRAVAREGMRRIGGRLFNAAWFFAMLFNGIYDHIVFGRTRGALFATLPILLAMGVATAVVLRSLPAHDDPQRPSRLSRFSIAPPSIAAVRAALWRTEQPVMLHWIGAGALVTVGVITVAVGLAVAVGHRMGVDFAAVDRSDGPASVAPLILLGAATLLSFPVAGYLVSRASRSHGVLEVAIASTLAIAGGLVLLGLAAPVTVVFAIAFAPIALGLACAGAWIGVTR